jgi:K+-transporting ATPase ATPase B chain
VTTEAARSAPRRRPRPPKARNTQRAATLFEPAIARRAVVQAFVKLNPRVMVRIPVMFLVEVGSVITTVDFIGRPSVFVGLFAAWLWATVLFANFAEAVAEGRARPRRTRSAAAAARRSRTAWPRTARSRPFPRANWRSATAAW